MAWYPGMVGGTALGRLLFGDVNFSGKLPVTWDTNRRATGRRSPTTRAARHDDGLLPRLPVLRHNGTALTPVARASFPFGYGLSYTTFSYQNLQVPCSTVRTGRRRQRHRRRHNQSAVAGTETVFLFVQYPGLVGQQPRRRSYKELKGFYRVSLAAMGTPGGRSASPIPLRVKDLKYWDTARRTLGGRARDGEGHRRAERQRGVDPVHRRRRCRLRALRHVHGQLNNAETGTNERTHDAEAPPAFSKLGLDAPRGARRLRVDAGGPRRRTPIRSPESQPAVSAETQRRRRSVQPKVSPAPAASPADSAASFAPGVVEQLPASAYPEPVTRGLYGGPLWLDMQGLQWPYMPAAAASASRATAGSTATTALIRIGNSGIPPHYTELLEQGRFLLRVTPTYTNGAWFVQAQAELVANTEPVRPAAAGRGVDVDDAWVRTGALQQWDVTVGRFQAFDVYPLGMGLDLNTYERMAPTIPFTSSAQRVRAVAAHLQRGLPLYRPAQARSGTWRCTSTTFGVRCASSCSASSGTTTAARTIWAPGRRRSSTSAG